MLIFIFAIGGITIAMLGIVGLTARIVRFLSSTLQSAMSVSILFVDDKMLKLVDKVSV